MGAARHVPGPSAGRPAAAADIVRRVREGVRPLRRPPGRPVLRRRQRNPFPHRPLARAGARSNDSSAACARRRAEDPGCLVTYVNYPSTEYLDLPFLDFVSFNVYLETKEKLDVYLAKLQVAAGDRPLLMAEVGLDSMRNGEEKQAATLAVAGAERLRGRLRGGVRLRLDR